MPVLSAYTSTSQRPPACPREGKRDELAFVIAVRKSIPTGVSGGPLLAQLFIRTRLRIGLGRWSLVRIWLGIIKRLRLRFRLRLGNRRPLRFRINRWMNLAIHLRIVFGIDRRLGLSFGRLQVGSGNFGFRHGRKTPQR